MPVLASLRTARNDKVVDTGEPRAGKTNSRFLHSGRDDTVVGTRGEFLDGPEGVARVVGAFPKADSSSLRSLGMTRWLGWGAAREILRPAGENAVLRDDNLIRVSAKSRFLVATLTRNDKWLGWWGSGPERPTAGPSAPVGMTRSWGHGENSLMGRRAWREARGPSTVKFVRTSERTSALRMTGWLGTWSCTQGPLRLRSGQAFDSCKSGARSG